MIRPFWDFRRRKSQIWRNCGMRHLVYDLALGGAGWGDLKAVELSLRSSKSTKKGLYMSSFNHFLKILTNFQKVAKTRRVKALFEAFCLGDAKVELKLNFLRI